MRFATLLAAAAALVGMSSAIEIIEMKNRHFYGTDSRKPFFIKGIDYQPGGSAVFKAGKDPLSDIKTCARDIYLFQQLGINTIRVYSVDPSLNHDECMTLLAEAGIYLVLDVNTPLENQHLNNQVPWTTYNPYYLEHIFSVVEVFSGYANTLAFLAGNEVVFDKISSKTTPNYVKAVVRDLKAYIEKHVSRVIPVGYSNADDLKFRTSLAAYLECGDKGYIDFFGVNSYQWCGHSSFKGSGYDKLVEDYSNYSLPVFFTEFGCNENPPRKWEEIGALYSDLMTGVFAGGLVYEYSQEENKFGLVKISSKTGKAETLDDYETLQAAYKNVSAEIKIPSTATAPTRPVTCPSEDSSIFKGITANLTLPTTLGVDLIKNGVGGKVTRGKFVTDPSTRATTFSIQLNGKDVTDKAVNSTDNADNKPLAAGGHGQATGGDVGSDSPDDSRSESTAGNTTPEGLVVWGAVVLGLAAFL